MTTEQLISQIRTKKSFLCIGLDVDLTKIETNSHFLKTLFSVFNTIKVPAPALQLDEFNGLRGHFVYF